MPALLERLPVAMSELLLGLPSVGVQGNVVEVVAPSQGAGTSSPWVVLQSRASDSPVHCQMNIPPRKALEVLQNILCRLRKYLLASCRKHVWAAGQMPSRWQTHGPCLSLEPLRRHVWRDVSKRGPLDSLHRWPPGLSLCRQTAAGSSTLQAQRLDPFLEFLFTLSFYVIDAAYSCHYLLWRPAILSHKSPWWTTNPSTWSLQKAQA